MWYRQQILVFLLPTLQQLPTLSADHVSSFDLQVLQQIWEEAFAAIDKLQCIFAAWQHI